jgi:hypothetical protein
MNQAAFEPVQHSVGIVRYGQLPGDSLTFRQSYNKAMIIARGNVSSPGPDGLGLAA